MYSARYGGSGVKHPSTESMLPLNDEQREILDQAIEANSPDANTYLYRRLILPLANDGVRVDQLLVLAAPGAPATL